MKLQLSIRLVPIIGIIFLTLYFPPGGLETREVYGMDPGSSIGVIDLEIESLIDLESSSSVQFTRNFSVAQKQKVYLLHIDVEASENTVDDVYINANINNVMTSAHFKDSSSNYASPYSFYGGTRLSFEINPNTTISVLANTLNLTVEVQSSTLFGDLGVFQIVSASLEPIIPPVINSDSAITPIPLEISEGSWYIAPLSTLNERKLETKLFCDITEETHLRLDIELGHSEYTLASTDFEVSNGPDAYKNESSVANSIQSSIIVNVTAGDRLVLEFTFRPTSDLANNVIKLPLTVKATPVTITPDRPPSGADEENSGFDVNFLNMELADLELIRFSMILIPLILYFNRNKNQNKLESSDLNEKGDIIGTNEK